MLKWCSTLKSFLMEYKEPFIPYSLEQTPRGVLRENWIFWGEAFNRAGRRFSDCLGEAITQMCASSLGRTFQRRLGNSLSSTSDNTGCQRRQLRNIIGIFSRPCGVSSNGRQAVYPSKYEYNYHYCMSFYHPRHYVKITQVYLRRWSRRKQRIIIIYVQLTAVTKSWIDLE